MRERYIWAAVVLALSVGAIGLSATSPVRHEANTDVAALAPVALASAPKVAPPASAASVNGSEEPPLGAQIEHLIATHSPEDAYAAYTLILDCETFNRDHDRLIYDLEEVRQKRNMIPYRGMTESEKKHDAKLCAGMTQRMRMSRFEYLSTAAQSGVSGAVVQIAEEGPFGDRSALTTRPDDPLVQEWKAKVRDQLKNAADSGELAALKYLWVHTLTGDALVAKDTALAYRYALAQGFIASDINGPQALEATTFAPEGQLLRAMFDLSPEQRMAERAAAQRIADNARAHRTTLSH